MPFRYLMDPLFLTCFGVYWLNRCLEDYNLSAPLLRCYLNDLICIPFWVPIMLWGLRKLGLRKHDRPPEGFEIVIPLLIWTYCFEVLVPSQREWSIPTVPDPYDILCYSLGALAAAVFWKWHYRHDERKAEELS